MSSGIKKMVLHFNHGKPVQVTGLNMRIVDWTVAWDRSVITVAYSHEEKLTHAKLNTKGKTPSCKKSKTRSHG